MTEPAKAPMRRDDGAVAMIDPSGEAVWVPADQASVALGQGFRAESAVDATTREKEIELNKTGALIKTGAAGLARGATMGLSDAAVGFVDTEAAAGLDELRQAHPTLSGVSEVAGAIIPALATGGGGAAAGAAAFTPAGMAARAGMAAEGLVGRAVGGLAGRGAVGRGLAAGLKTGASGAVEGAAFGAGGAMSEAALTNTDLTAEKLLVGGLEGLALGGGAGFALGGVGGLLAGGGRAASKVAGAADEVADVAAAGERGLLAQTADDLANRQTMKALGLQGSDVAKLEAKFGGPEGLGRVTRRLHDEGLISAADSLPQRAAKLEARLKQAGEEIGTIIKRVDAEGAKLPTGLSVMQRLRAEVVDGKFGGNSLERAANGPLIKKLEREVLGPLAKADQAGDMTLESLWNFRKTLDGKSFKEFGQTTNGAESLRAAREVIEDEIEKTIGRQSTDLATSYKQAKQDYRDFGDLSKATTKRAGMEEGNRFLSLSDNIMIGGGLAGAIAAGDPEAAVGAAGLGLLNRFARTRGTVAAAKIARRLADVNTRKATAVRAIVDDAAPKPAMTKGASKLAAGDMAQRAARISLLAAEDAGAAPIAVDTQGRPDSDFPVVLSQVQEAAADPMAYAEKVSDQLGDIAHDEPTLADAIVRNAIADAHYLASHAPAGYNRADSGSVTPLAEVAAIPRHQIEGFMRRVQALNDPLSVAEAIANGDLPLEGIDALKMRRPEMYQEIRGDIIEAATQRDKPMPFTKRTTLGIAFEFPADPSLDRGYTMRVQQTYEAAAKAVQEKKQPPPPRGRPDSGAIMTPAQKLAMGG